MYLNAHFEGESERETKSVLVQKCVKERMKVRESDEEGESNRKVFI